MSTDQSWALMGKEFEADRRGLHARGLRHDLQFSTSLRLGLGPQRRQLSRGLGCEG